MAYTVLELANRSLNLAGIVSANFQTPTGDQTTSAVSFLNDILADKTVDTAMIPYYSELDWTAIPGQPDYYIPNLIDVETLVFFIGSVRYAMTDINRRSFFGDPRADCVNSLPFNYHVERMLGGAKIFLYFTPEQAYNMKLWGMFRLQQVSINDDLEKTIDRFYINYLRYKLAERLCREWNYEVPPTVTAGVQEYDAFISKLSAKMDIVMNKISPLSPFARGVNYGVVNLGPWQPN